ncbi:MAG: HAMP domain-containing histidine kinase [Colwellia sp.]|nr:HAMP domain-containing histidine kinase [Colwellia sp.]
MVISITLMTIIISLVTTTGVNQQYRQLMLKNAYQITEGLAKQAVFSILSGSEQNAEEAMNQVIGFQSVLSAQLRLEDQKVFLTLGEFPNDINNNQLLNTTQTMITVETPKYWLIKTPIKVLPDNEESEFELELDSNSQKEKIIGYAEVTYSKDYLLEAQAQINLLITIVGISSVVLLGFILRFGLLKLFKPLGELAHTMQKSKATGEYVLAVTAGAKEIQNMASAYNSMMKALNQQDIDLKSHRDQLEKEVDSRTSELVEARDTALNASRHKSEFMANMSHELRTPIQSIIGYGELVTEELELEANFELIDDMDKIEKNAQRLLFMINSLLDLAKIESGKIDINKMEVTVNDIITNIIDTVTPLSKINNNQFIIEQNNDNTRIVVDKEKLEQVLLNLLSNACKFTKNGRVSLIVYSDKSHIHFEIKDSGIGLSAEQQNYIFDEFRQVDSSQARQFSGTGLGLAISKRFVELMDGKINVVSELQHGASFTVSLPLNSKQ